MWHHFIKDVDEVADVTQEAFIKAYRALPILAVRVIFTWLYRIAVNTGKNYLLSKSRRPKTADIDIGEVEHTAMSDCMLVEASPESELLGEELRQVIENAVGALPEDLRTALTRAEFDGMSYEDIALSWIAQWVQCVHVFFVLENL